MNPHRKITRALRLRSRIYWLSRWANGDYVSDTPAVIVGGSVRSGTTLMRTMLDSHPNVAAGPESWLFVHRPSFGALAANYDLTLEAVETIRRRSSCLPHFIDLFFEDYARRMGKTRWAEKSPANVMRLDYIWRHFPAAKFIHMIRDGRDVVCSIRSQRERLRSEGMNNEPEGTLDDRIKLWKSSVEAGIAWRGDPRYLEVRYEELVTSVEDTLRRTFDFVGEPWSDNVLRAHECQLNRQQKLSEYGTPEVHKSLFRTSIGRWRRDLTVSDSRRVWEKAGALLEGLGYAR